MKKNCCRIVALMLCLFLLVGMLSCLGELTRVKGESCYYEAFVEKPREYDVLFFGNSHMWNGVFPMELWAESGVRAYNMSYSASLMGGLYWIVRCALDQASPEVIVLDTYLIANDDSVMLPYFEDAMASLPFSFNKIRAAFDLCPPGEYAAEDRAAVVWGFSIFHSRWPELTEEDFSPIIRSGYGTYALVNVAPPAGYVPTDEALPLDDSYPNVPYLRRIAALCRERGVRLVLTTLPYPANHEEAMTANGVKTLAEELGVEYLNMLDMGLVDYQTDLFDSSSHLNVSGAMKVTRYLGNYLRDVCGLSDHRDDPACSAWREDYLLWRHEADVRLEEQRVLQRTLMLLSDPNYAAVIRIAPGSPLLTDPLTKPLLQNLCGGVELPGFDGAATAGQAYLLLANRGEGLVMEMVGSDVLGGTLWGDLCVEPELSRMTLGGDVYTLSAKGDVSGSDCMCFVFNAGMEPLPACSHAFALTSEGIYERCDY